MKGIIQLGHTYVTSNKLEKDLLQMLILCHGYHLDNDFEIEGFKKWLFEQIETINAKHPRCKAKSVHWFQHRLDSNIHLQGLGHSFTIYMAHHSFPKNNITELLEKKGAAGL